MGNKCLLGATQTAWFEYFSFFVYFVRTYQHLHHCHLHLYPREAEGGAALQA